MPEMKVGELMNLMNTKGGSLELYKEVFEWHMRHRQTESSVTAEHLHDVLIKRYNLQDTMPIELRTRLPFSQAIVDVVTHDCTAMTVDLITDPHIAPEDYLSRFLMGIQGILPLRNSRCWVMSTLAVPTERLGKH